VLSRNVATNLAQQRRLFPLTLVLLLAVLGFGAIGLPQQALGQKNSKPASETSAAGVVARGKYIVEGVAMCGQCHTPHDSKGNPDRSHWLQGGSLPYAPPTPDPNWPVSAPRIGGNPPANDADMVKLLTTGIWITGSRLRFPMPQFRLERSDAEAVVAYLKSVPAR
jgi:mono/diheme cytochrome c family protein